MSKTNDTIDGLLAEFHGYSAGMPPSYHVTMSWAHFRKMLDRFDVAHKRELDELKKVGNAAKLREAIDYLCERMADMDATFDPSEVECLRAALAAPLRNCDVYNSESCRLAYHLHGDGLMTMQAFADWLFAPATEKEGGDDGR